MSLFPVFEHLSTNNHLSKRQFFFTDKDFSERGTIIKNFKNATLGLCYFYIIKKF